MERAYVVHGRTVQLGVHDDGTNVTVTIDGTKVSVQEFDLNDRYLFVTLDGRTHRLLYARAAGRLHVAFGGHDFAFTPAEDDGAGTNASTVGFAPEVISPMPGKVLEVLVTEGETVEPEQPLLLLEAMKMEQTVRSPGLARVLQIVVETDAMVGPGETLVVLEPIEDEASL